MGTLMTVGVNQTPRDALKVLELDPGRAGTGFFAVADPETGILDLRVLQIDNLTYLECCKRGANCFYFKWLPKQDNVFEAKAPDLRSAIFAGFCEKDSDCPDGFICDKATFRCI